MQPPETPQEPREDAPAAATTLGETVRAVATALRDADFDEPQAEARMLVALASGVTSIDMLSRPEMELSAEARANVAAWLARRLRHEPLSRIAGEREFHGRPFRLSPGTLDPRPDTEVVVEMALELLAEAPVPGRPVRLLDIGTGTGAIAITLLAERPDATGVATDLSEDALATTADNAARHGVGARLRPVRADMTVSDDMAPLGRFDLIVSNPPYIPTAEVATLEPAVRFYDPPLALDGGGDGLDAYRALVRLQAMLEPGGWMVLEVGAGQAGDVAELFRRCDPTMELRTRRDLGGHTRVVAVRPHRRTSGE